ncbi:MAG: hypothetical protein GMKNLPBB_01688 [Myxococcota bacterium]|nr:hypothetical protein [Myxococcota bacterium]
MKPFRPVLAGFAAAALLPLWSASARAEELIPRELQGVTIEEQFGAEVDLNLTFTTHEGETVPLRELVKGDVPVLLTLNYYRCKMLCSMQLNGLLEGLKKFDWTAGENFRIVTISIDHREGWELGRDKRASYLKALGRGDQVDWTFAVGTVDNIRKLAKSVGFGYRYDPEQDQFGHAAGVMFLSPQGRVMRYLFGIEYRPLDIKFALMDAAEGRVGTPIERILLSCFHYDAALGNYAPWAFGVMRLGAIITMIVLGAFLTVMWRREKPVQLAEETP